MTRLIVTPKRFTSDRRGSIPVIFAVALLPLLIGAGGAIDYGRASQVRVDAQSAVDAAALVVGRAAIELGRTDNAVQARQAFDAGFQATGGIEVVRFNVDQNEERLVVEAAVRVPMVFGHILRLDHIDVGARAEVPLDDMTVEVALVLDNSGSMQDPGKLPALRTASNNLITKLQNASTVNTQAFVALVPFAAQVRLPLPFPISAAPDPVNTVPGVRINHPKDSAEARLRVTFPWHGCLVDRDKPHDAKGYDQKGTRLDKNRPETLLPAANCNGAPSPLRPLNRDFAQLRTQVNNMVSGNMGSGTNLSIALASGLAVLTPNLGVLSTGAHEPSRLVKKHIIFLTDGENSRNRWTSNTAEIDQQTQAICNEIKQSSLNIVLHTVLLMEGNETLLRNCATTPQRFYFVTDPAQLNAVFDAIAAELLSIRLAR